MSQLLMKFGWIPTAVFICRNCFTSVGEIVQFGFGSSPQAARVRNFSCRYCFSSHLGVRSSAGEEYFQALCIRPKSQAVNALNFCGTLMFLAETLLPVSDSNLPKGLSAGVLSGGMKISASTAAWSDGPNTGSAASISLVFLGLPLSLLTVSKNVPRMEDGLTCEVRWRGPGISSGSFASSSLLSSVVTTV